MSSYLEVLKQALIFFPFIAFFISIPFILIEYHKFGSISFLKSLIIYSFVLYFICAYFLIILPLPKISVVERLTTPRTQLIPFSFIIDFIKETSFRINDIHTYLISIKEGCFFVPIYNILLTLPFGIYLRYYFHCDLKKTVIYTFLLSLFFELTQLSGLYFIYPRGYRLFDIDDLMLNTLGGVLGYLIGKRIVNKLPTREVIDIKAREKGKIVSGLRRTTSFLLDLFLFIFIQFIISIFIKNRILSISIIPIYYVILPYLLGGSTLSQKFLNLKIIDNKNKNNIFRLLLRIILFILIYLAIPFGIGLYLEKLYLFTMSEKLKECIFIGCCGIIFLIYAITAIKFLFTNKDMLYEKLSRTKIISTIK